MLCPCGTGKSYIECCKPFHEGRLPDTALLLMRSRYSAYALSLPVYIMETTHPKNAQFSEDQDSWAQDIEEFCLHTKFHKLEILDAEDGKPFATVTFTAHLSQNKQDASFTERSAFEKVDGKWLYLSGQFL